MRKITTLLAFLLFAVTQGAFAQKTITGKVISSEDDLGMPGVPVVVKGTTVGTATDIDGNFTLSVPNDAATLVVSYMGYRTVELPVGNQTRFEVTLDPDAIALGDVVVTALGIQRETKTLTYSAQQVDGAEMMKAQDINFMSALSGKAAGLEIKKSSAGAGGSTKTILRGNKSLSGVSEPLYVIDGVPMVNRKSDRQGGMWGSPDEGDGISQLNPEDIESISVLKGSNAAILYGSQGANGVIMITTKKGKEGTVDVSLSSSTMFESVSALPELQFKYGQAIPTAMESWSTTAGNYDDTFVKDFYQMGYNLVNNLAISGGTGKTTAYFSYGNTAARGIIENNSYLKHNVTFKQSTKMLKDKITLTSNILLTNERTKNRYPGGFYLNPITGVYFFPRNMDFNYYKNNYQLFNENTYLNEQNWFVENHYQSNPYWIINNHPREDSNKRIIASINLDYNIAKGLNLKIRGTYDYADKINDQRFMATSNVTNVAPSGRWNYRKYTDWQSYVDGILTYSTNFGDFSLNALAGASTQMSRYGDGVSVDNGTRGDLLYPNIFSFQNMPANVLVNSMVAPFARIVKHGAFANASIGYKEMIFLDLSGRNDWSSTLALTGNESYFYPAVGLSAIVSQMVSLPDFVTFGKVRGSYSVVANEVPFDVINRGYQIGNSRSAEPPTRAPFFEATPEMLASLEIGTDWRFLEGRMGFDFTYYDITSTDQFIEVPALAGTGYTNRYISAGKITNKGIELMVDAEPVVTSNFSWRTALNFTRNKNTIVEIEPGQPDNYISMGSSDGFYSYLATGGSYSDIWTLNFVTDAQGRKQLDKNGNFIKTSSPEKIGGVDPDFTLGWNNTFSYKNWSMGFLVNGVFGGNVVSYTEMMLDEFGVSKASADARDKGSVEINAVDIDGNPVTTMDPETYYRTVGGRNNFVCEYMYDRTNIRLTQFSLTYDIPVRTLNWPLKSASVALVGQNLLFLYKNAPHDPELGMNMGRDQQGVENFALPSTRTYGFNIKVNF